MKALVAILFLLETAHLVLLVHSAVSVFILYKLPENTLKALIIPL